MTELVRYQSTPPENVIELAPKVWQLVVKIVNTEAVPRAVRGKPESALAIVLTGHEAGISPMQALQKIHVIDGRVAMSAELMRALVFQHGHEIWIEELTNTRCRMIGQRAGSTRTSVIEWTIDDARSAGLLGKDPWKKYPRAMLQARATAELCRLIFPDVLAGISYVPDEIDSGEPAPAGAPETPNAVAPPRQRAKATHAATAPPSAPEPEPPLELPDDPIDAELVEHVPGPSTWELEPEPELVPEPETAREVIVERFGEGRAPVLELAAELVDRMPPDVIEDAELVVDDDETGPSYTVGQLVAMRFGEAGIRDRDARLEITSALVGREITSSNDLTPDEVRTVLDAIASGTVTAAPGPVAAPATPDPVDPPADGQTEGAAAPAARARRAPVPPLEPERTPEQWTGDDWRAFISARKVKAVPVMKEANRLGAAAGRQVGTLDEIAGAGIAADLVGFIEELSLR